MIGLIIYICNIFECIGYQVIYGVWDVFDISGIFYNMIDVEFDGVIGEVVVFEWIKFIGNIELYDDLNVGDIVKLCMFDQQGECSDLVVEIIIVDVKEGKKNNWFYVLVSKLNNIY